MKWSFQLYLLMKLLYRPHDLGYVKCFQGKSSSVKFACRQPTFEKENFPSQSLSLCKDKSRIRKQMSLVMIRFLPS